VEKEALAELTRGARSHVFGRGELLRDIGEMHGFVYILIAGRVGLSSFSRHGREILLSTFHEGRYGGPYTLGRSE